MEEYAQGRVWTGKAARERNLVDVTGGISKAIQIAKEKAGIAPEKQVGIFASAPIVILSIQIDVCFFRFDWLNFLVKCHPFNNFSSQDPIYLLSHLEIVKLGA